MSLLLHLLADIVILAVFGIALHVMEVSDWDHGITRNAALAGTMLAVAILWLWRSRRAPSAPPRRYVLALCVVAGLLLGWRSVQSWDKLGAVPLDIAFSTLDSIKAVVREHKDPYAKPIDSRKEAPADAKGFRYYHGYKYLPGMMLVYAPLAVPFEFPGILFTNYLIFLATGLLIYLLAKEAGGRWAVGGGAAEGDARHEARGVSLTSDLRPPTSGLSAAGLRGVILFLSLGIVPLEMFEKGVNDLAPMVPLLFAIFALSRGWMLAAGVAVGFSVGTKLLPGALIALMFLPLARSRWFVLAAGLTIGAVCIPFVTWHPREFVANVLLFNLDRPPDTTSIAYYLPLKWQKPWLYAGGIVILGSLAAWFAKKNKDWRTLAFVGALVVTALLVFGTMVHRNYLLWVIPLWCVLLPWTAYPTRRTADGG
ncbi:MAG: DUF2029 domain-containing protein [Deltaproteobacteria bacterium]|nr:DUF2029 domain-containing protein [Deltaproteobacteria bacterium]